MASPWGVVPAYTLAQGSDGLSEHLSTFLQEACSDGDGGVSDGGLETEQTCQSGRPEEELCVWTLPAVPATQVLPALTLNLQTHIHPASLFSMPSPALWFPPKNHKITRERRQASFFIVM